MNETDSLRVELAGRLQELQRELERLAELRHAYRVVERSKFARLQALVSDAKALLGRAPANLTLFSETPVLAGLSGRTAAAIAADYPHWVARNAARDSDLQRMRQMQAVLPYRPLISIVMATYETPERYLREAIDSVRAQVYPEWQLCIADDASALPHVRNTLEEYAALDGRISVTYRAHNGHIAAAGNSALALATGTFVGFLDHDDLLTPDALFEMALALNRHPDADMLYSDEDKVDENGGLREPHFKPDWSPDSFLSRMYTCHFGVYRRSLVEELGGLRPAFSGSQDYDLVLRLTEHTKRIHHVPRVLYHWRMHGESTSTDGRVKPYSSRAALRALSEALERRGEPGTVSEREDCPGVYIVRYAIREPKKVSVIVPTRDHGDDVDRCLASLFAKTSYPDLEVILLDNGSTDRSSLGVFRRWQQDEPRVRVVRYDEPFNFSTINNYAVKQATGAYLLFLNNDTEVQSEGWIEAMVEQAQRPSIGAVGALLLYPDGTVQHAGVIVGLGGVAGHSHKHYPAESNGYINMLKAINNYSAVTAACMMTRRSVFEEVGGFDDKLTVAFNDVDLCLKIGAAGYRIVSLPHVVLTHFESKSRGHETTNEKQRRFSQEIALIEARWKTRQLSDPHYSVNLTLDREDYSLAAR